MALQKPQISTCLDGRDHNWLIVATEDPMAGDDSRLEHRWCRKCGCLTQVGLDLDGQPVAAIGEDGQPYLVTPKILELIIK